MGLKEKIKFHIAEYLDKRHPEYCWGQLAMWAMGYEEVNPWGKGVWNYKNFSCDKSAFCGKCFTTGRIKRPEKLRDKVIPNPPKENKT